MKEDIWGIGQGYSRTGTKVIKWKGLLSPVHQHEPLIFHFLWFNKKITWTSRVIFLTTAEPIFPPFSPLLFYLPVNPCQLVFITPPHQRNGVKKHFPIESSTKLDA